MANDELYTPKFIFDALKIDFDLDVCAPEQGPLHTPAHKWYSLKDDGLVKPWFGRVWMNPPYSNPGVWVDKWLDHKNGFALVQISKAFGFINYGVVQLRLYFQVLILNLSIKMEKALVFICPSVYGLLVRGISHF